MSVETTRTRLDKTVRRVEVTCPTCQAVIYLDAVAGYVFSCHQTTWRIHAEYLCLEVKEGKE